MKHETKSILDYLKAIAWVVVPFCLLGSLHYLFVFFPRTVCEKDNHILFNHLGFDYFGVVVGFFTLLVTLLVGWQIFSNIKERERIDKLTESNTNFRNELERRIKALEDCCENRKKEIENLADAVNESLGKTLMIAENHFAEIYKNLILGETELGHEYLFLSYRIQALGDAAKIGEIKGCNLIVSDIMQTLNKIWPVTMTARSKKDLIDDLLEVDSPDKIVGYDDLRTALSKIKTNPNAKGL